MRKVNNIAEYPSIQDFVHAKLARYEQQSSNFHTLFDMMFSERDNVMTEITDGFRIKKTTYGEFYDRILATVPCMKRALGQIEPNRLIGLYMDNSQEWIVAFWSILACGYRPLLMNTRLSVSVLEDILHQHDVAAVITDSQMFSVPTFNAGEVLVREEPTGLTDNFGSEVVFMTSGTTTHVKLCAYTAEDFFYQLKCSEDVVKNCRMIIDSDDGEIRHLMLLPLYHVFGFIAVYLWFGFFARTFVFLKNMSPDTILNTVRKHRVTHVFAVPLVWNTIHREAVRKIQARGDNTYRRFQRALSVCNRTGALGDRLATRLLAEVRDGIFGDSIRCMISGGSSISPDVLAFFNGIGYPLMNGYGMTEIGITSVEQSAKKSVRNSGSVGKPFSCVSYRLSERGELLIQSHAMASRVINGHDTHIVNKDDWFGTCDLAREANGHYYLHGRADDLIVGVNGENINPNLVEPQINVDGCRELCLFKSNQGEPILLVSAPDCRDAQAYQNLVARLRDALSRLHLAGEIKTIAVTVSPLMEGADFKISRRRLAQRYADGALHLLTDNTIDDYTCAALSATEQTVRELAAQAFKKPLENIGRCDNFFSDLGGTSLEYFSLRESIKQHCGVDILESEVMLSTVKSCSDYILNKKR